MFVCCLNHFYNQLQYRLQLNAFENTNTIPYFSKFENILPDELTDIEIAEELSRARNEINKIIEEDLRKIKDLTIRQNKSIAFNEFTKPASIIRMALYIEGDPSYDDVSFYFAHWTMSFSTLRSLAHSVIDISTELKTYYNNYLKANSQTQRQESEWHLIISFVLIKDSMDI